ncbi:condensation domain-containing protein [Nonomuraea sp. NPDC052116]|uniref:condensation domain-containing protein n=1 Tax=Nonomuraea sp. NPDC052116 TaxID=3155665 RepID=UPI003413556A
MTDGYPVTPTQRDLFLHHLRFPRDTNYSLGMTGRLPPDVDTGRWADAVAHVWAAEPLAATSFRVSGAEVRHTTTAAAGSPPFEVVELTGSPETAFTRFVAERVLRSYDLAEPPLVSTFLCRGGDGVTAVLAAPHLLLDGSSGRVFLDRVCAAYRGAPANDPASPGFLDLAAGIAARFDEPDTLAHWKSVGAGLVAVRAEEGEGGAETEDLVLPAGRLGAMAVRCAELGVSVPSALLAAYAAAIACVCAPAGPFPVYTLLGGRDARSRHLMGCFFHVLPYVFDPDTAEPAGLLGRVRGYRRALGRRAYLSVQRQRMLLPSGGVRFTFNYYDFTPAELLGRRGRVSMLESYPPDEVHLIAGVEPGGSLRLRLAYDRGHLPGPAVLKRLPEILDHLLAAGETVHDG